jgi:hypothetical protein
MSDNALTTTQVPAHIAARIAARKGQETTSAMDSVLQGGKFPYPKISIRAGRYRLVEDGNEVPIGITLDVVVVGANPHTSKIYYGRPFDPNATDSRPDCFSNDGITPDASVQKPVSKTCATCSHNVLGSKITPSGAKSKLCSDQKFLAVVPAADPSKIYSLSIPVSAMKNMREYFTSLKNFGLIVEEVVTELGFDETTSYPRITFRHKGYLDSKGIGAVETLVKERDSEIREITREKPLSGTAAAPAVLGPVAAAGSLAAPADEPPADDDLPFDVGQPQAKSELESKLDSLFGG